MIIRSPKVMAFFFPQFSTDIELVCVSSRPLSSGITASRQSYRRSAQDAQDYVPPSLRSAYPAILQLCNKMYVETLKRVTRIESANTRRESELLLFHATVVPYPWYPPRLRMRKVATADSNGSVCRLALRIARSVRERPSGYLSAAIKSFRRGAIKIPTTSSGLNRCNV